MARNLALDDLHRRKHAPEEASPEPCMLSACPVHRMFNASELGSCSSVGFGKTGLGIVTWVIICWYVRKARAQKRSVDKMRPRILIPRAKHSSLLVN